MNCVKRISLAWTCCSCVVGCVNVGETCRRDVVCDICLTPADSNMMYSRLGVAAPLSEVLFNEVIAKLRTSSDEVGMSFCGSSLCSQILLVDGRPRYLLEVWDEMLDKTNVVSIQEVKDVYCVESGYVILDGSLGDNSAYFCSQEYCDYIRRLLRTTTSLDSASGAAAMQYLSCLRMMDRRTMYRDEIGDVAHVCVLGVGDGLRWSLVEIGSFPVESLARLENEKDIEEDFDSELWLDVYYAVITHDGEPVLMTQGSATSVRIGFPEYDRVSPVSYGWVVDGLSPGECLPQVTDEAFNRKCLSVFVGR